MPPTQKELAKLAGVSTGTVSNVIREAPGVSERSRKKVHAAIKALNYQPNLIARSLKTNRTHTLGIVVPDITIPFFPKLIRGAELAARREGYFLIVLDSENNQDREAEMLALLRSQRVEGILLVAAGESATPAGSYGAISFPGPPVVCLDRLPQGLAVDSVCVDDFPAAELAVTHLMERGHSKIAIITGPLFLRNEQERLRGYRHALKNGGIPVRESLIWKGSFEEEEVALLCQQGLLRFSDKPTALFATNGVTGLAALKSIFGMGLSTPGDLAFVTFDELTSEEIFRPGITSVVQPAFEIGVRAVDALLKRIAGGDAFRPLEKVRLPAKLYVRESSSAPLVKASSEQAVRSERKSADSARQKRANS
jgi:DNA-binding LacI/PurR family transcriptional regulator